MLVVVVVVLAFCPESRETWVFYKAAGVQERWSVGSPVHRVSGVIRYTMVHNLLYIDRFGHEHIISHNLLQVSDKN